MEASSFRAPGGSALKYVLRRLKARQLTFKVLSLIQAVYGTSETSAVATLM